MEQLFFGLNSWAGFQRVPCEMIKINPKRSRVKILKDCMKGKTGKEILVPNYALFSAIVCPRCKGDSCDYCSDGRDDGNQVGVKYQPAQ